MSAIESRQQRYGTILRLDDLLRVAHVDEGSVDLMLFLSSHQIYEVWFALILRHLEEARTALCDDDATTATARLRPLPAIVRVLVAQFDVLAGLAPASFEAIRTELGAASGLQSVQFREIEFVCGLRDTRFLDAKGLTERERERLRLRLGEPSLTDVFAQFRRRSEQRGGASPSPQDVAAVQAAMLDVDEAMVLWRTRHACLAERFLGSRRRGTGGSDGASYLWRAAGRRLFRGVWPNDGDAASASGGC